MSTRSIPKLVLFVICIGAILYHIAPMIQYYATAKGAPITPHVPYAPRETGNATSPPGIRTTLGASAACVFLASLGLFDWVVYTLLTIFFWKSTTSGAPVYTLDGTQHVAVYVYLLLGGIFGGVHFVLLTRGHFFWLNLTMLALSAFCYAVSIFKASLDLEKFKSDLIESGAFNQISLVKMFVVNALLPITAWMLILLFTGVTELVKYESTKEQLLLNTAMLATILGVFFLIFVLELIFRDHGNYFLLHHLVLFMYAIGAIVMSEEVPKGSPNFILPVVMVVVSLIQISVKLGLIVAEMRKRKDHTPI